jgi:hypothetical protein
LDRRRRGIAKLDEWLAQRRGKSERHEWHAKTLLKA